MLVSILCDLEKLFTFLSFIFSLGSWVRWSLMSLVAYESPWDFLSANIEYLLLVRPYTILGTMRNAERKDNRSSPFSGYGG